MFDLPPAPTVRARPRAWREPAHVEASLEVPRLSGLGLATPSQSLTQEEMLDLLGLAGNPFGEGIFANCGVRTRRLEISPELVRETLQARTPATEEQLLRLAVQAVDELAVDLADVGVVVSATYYSLGSPTLAQRIAERYGLAPSADKYHLVGVGCASAVPLLRLAGQALRDRPGEKALVIAAESVSGFLTAVRPGDPKVKVIGSALFGDGCAAALLGSGPTASGPAVLATAVYQVPGTLDRVRFEVTPDDAHMEIAQELPAIAERSLRPLVDRFLGAQGLRPETVDHWLVHPGGRGILEAVQRGLDLDHEDVAASAHVLAEVGNVGTPTSFFVLAETLERRRPASGEHGLIVSIGPGVTVGLALLGW